MTSTLPKLFACASIPLAFSAIPLTLYSVYALEGTVLAHQNFKKEISELTDHNLSVFNQMAQTQGAVFDTANPWKQRQSDITYRVRSNDMGINWSILDFEQAREDLIIDMDVWKIAIIPGQPGSAATLTVDRNHGCLQVDPARSNGQIEDDIVKIMKVKTDLGDSATGTFTLKGNVVSFVAKDFWDDKIDNFARFADGVCPAPQP